MGLLGMTILFLVLLQPVLSMPRATPSLNIRVLGRRVKLAYCDKAKAVDTAKELKHRMRKIQSGHGIRAARAAFPHQLSLARKRAGSALPGSHLTSWHQAQAGKLASDRVGQSFWC